MKKTTEDQLSFFHLKLCKGDSLYRSGEYYGEIVDESETLYYVQKASSSSTIPSPCDKKRLIERIISGELTVPSFRY